MRAALIAASGRGAEFDLQIQIQAVRVVIGWLELLAHSLVPQGIFVPAAASQLWEGYDRHKLATWKQA